MVVMVQGQHPSQCLLDLMTITKSLEPLKILDCIAGDITHSRVAKSNMQILKRLSSALFCWSCKWYSNEFDVYGQHVAIDVIEDLDVLMLLRVLLSVMGMTKDFKRDYHALYGLTEERYANWLIRRLSAYPAPVNRDVKLLIVWLST